MDKARTLFLHKHTEEAQQAMIRGELRTLSDWDSHLEVLVAPR
jgi:hypothetical protein